MPELPEVETIRRSLEPVLRGARLVKVELARADLRFPFPERFVERLEGRRVTALSRRAKYLLVRLDNGDVLVIHLGMSGRLVVAVRNAPTAGGRRGRLVGSYTNMTGRLVQHDHVVLHLEDGSRVTYNDPRRFGFMLLVKDSELAAHPLFRHLGLEPLGEELTGSALAREAHGRRADLKSFLMNQAHVAGLGNIYVSEALFRARLSPLRRAGTLALKDGRASQRAEALAQAIRAVVEDAVAAGGSTLRDYVQADGRPGAFQSAHAVYDREGKPCARAGCTGVVRRRVQGQRSTFYCPVCQR